MKLLSAQRRKETTKPLHSTVVETQGSVNECEHQKRNSLDPRKESFIKDTVIMFFQEICKTEINYIVLVIWHA
jgi:hypothetical protein